MTTPSVKTPAVKTPAVTTLVDARAMPDWAAPVALSDHQWVVGGPGREVDLPADATERELLQAMVAAARAPVCVWLQAGDVPDPGRHLRMRSAMVALGTAVVAHAMPWTPGQRSGGTGRLPPAAVLGLVEPGALAFRRDVFDLVELDGPEGCVHALALWALRRGGVGWVDDVLLDARRRLLPAGPLARERVLARRVQAAHTAVRRAPPALVPQAVRRLVVAVERWTDHRAGLEDGRRRLLWSRGAPQQDAQGDLPQTAGGTVN
jgi:hypothetical protein